MNKNIQPPRWANRILEKFCSDEYLDEVLGDLYEVFYQRQERFGLRRARIFYIIDVFKSLRNSNRPKVKQTFSQGKNYMLGNYIKMNIRNMSKNRLYSALNILGLSTGITCTLLILLFVKQETDYDSFHADAARIYRITEKYSENGEIIENSASLPWSVGTTLWTDYPDVKTVRMYQTWQKTPLISNLEDEIHFYEDKLFFVDSTFFDVFSFPLVSGNKETVLRNPGTLIITEKIAAKYFPGENPIGKVLRFEDSLDFTIEAVAKDVPVNSHFHFEFLSPLLNIGDIFKASGNSWNWVGWYWNPVHTYIKLPKRYSAQQFDNNLASFVKKHFPKNMVESVELRTQPLKEIHLKSNLYQELEPNGNERSILIALAIAGFILLIASINFINLTTARSFQRAKEVGLRKVLGSSRGQLVIQFFAESITMAFLALIVSTLLFAIFLGAFENMVETTLNLTELLDLRFIGIVVAGTFSLGMISGFYPAIMLSGFNPIKSLKIGSSQTGSRGTSLLRKGLVIFQFTISIVLLISAATIFRQYKFLTGKKLGFNKEEIIIIPIQGTNVINQREAFKNELAQNAQVVASCAISDIVGTDAPNRPFGVRGQEQRFNLPGLFTDHDFIKTFQIELVDGRDFNKATASDVQTTLINRKMIELLPEQKWEGEMIQFGNTWRPIIGVIDDFHFMDLRHEVRPLIISFSDSFIGYLAVRVKPGSISQTITILNGVWKQFEPVRPFTPFFLDDRLNQLYQKEETTGQMIGYFSVLAIFIACLGLLGLATYSTQVRIKEIGIRKVMGASSSSILALLNKDFVILVIIALAVASPIAWYLMDTWLSSFTYRIGMNWIIFALAGILALIVAVIVISINTIKAASSNPVDSIRAE